MEQHQTLLAGMLIAAAILLYALDIGARSPLYEMTATANTGQPAWRINTRTGQVSMCRSSMSAAGFYGADPSITHSLIKLNQPAPKQEGEHLVHQVQNRTLLSR